MSRWNPWVIKLKWQGWINVKYFFCFQELYFWLNHQHFYLWSAGNSPDGAYQEDHLGHTGEGHLSLQEEGKWRSSCDFCYTKYQQYCFLISKNCQKNENRHKYCKSFDQSWPRIFSNKTKRNTVRVIDNIPNNWSLN